MSSEIDSTPAFKEYRLVPSGDPLRQGDVLESVHTDESIWRQRLVVLTADCDFAHAKHQGRVTCVPILASSDYLHHFQMPALRMNYEKKPKAELIKAIAGAGYGEISEERLISWVREESTEDILLSLDVQPTRSNHLAHQVDALRRLHETHHSLEAGMSAFAEAIELAGSSASKEEASKKIRSDLRSRLNSPPGDVMFLSTIGPGMKDGNFVYLRHIEQLWESEIATGPTKSKVTHRRLARLTDRITDAIAQRFGMVFMSIGLPVEYEAARRAHTEHFAEGTE